MQLSFTLQAYVGKWASLLMAAKGDPKSQPAVRIQASVCGSNDVHYLAHLPSSNLVRPGIGLRDVATPTIWRAAAINQYRSLTEPLSGLRVQGSGR